MQRDLIPSLQAGSTPRRILSDVSNNSVSSESPQSFSRQRLTPSRRNKQASSQKSTLGSELFNSPRRPSSTYGDLSQIRPKSPPLTIIPRTIEGLQLPDGDYVDDTRNLFSQNYNNVVYSKLDKTVSESSRKPPQRHSSPGPWNPRRSYVSLSPMSWWNISLTRP